jgi:hypothetical protein
MVNIGKILVVIGIVLAAFGVLLISGLNIPFLGRLPGDIHIKKDNFTFYFPFTTSILASLVLTLIFWLFKK